MGTERASETDLSGKITFPRFACFDMLETSYGKKELPHCKELSGCDEEDEDHLMEGVPEDRIGP